MVCTQYITSNGPSLVSTLYNISSYTTHITVTAGLEKLLAQPTATTTGQPSSSTSGGAPPTSTSKSSDGALRIPSIASAITGAVAIALVAMMV